MKLSALKRLFLAALLWLPAMFFVWVYWSSVFALPATRTAQAVLVNHYDSLFVDVFRGFPRDLIDPSAMPVQPGTPTEGSHARDDHLLLLRFNPEAMPPAMRAQQQATGEEPLPMVNSMIYGYGLALIWGLIMATPLSARRRWLQIGAGWLAIAVVQAFGLVTSALVQAMRHLGPESLRAAGVQPDLLAALYQFGYLILPAVVPVVLWMVMNRAFILSLTQPVPAAAAAVPELAQEPAAQKPVETTCPAASPTPPAQDRSGPGRGPDHGT